MELLLEKIAVCTLVPVLVGLILFLTTEFRYIQANKPSWAWVARIYRGLDLCRIKW